MANPAFLAYLPHLLVREVEEGRAAIVGGAVRSHFDQTPLAADIDVYVFSKEDNARMARELGAKEIPETDGHCHWLTGAIPIHLVYDEECASAEQCSAHADFDITGGVYSEGRFILPDGYAKAIQTKTMRFRHTVAPQASYWRYMKYSQKYGYRIDGSIHKLLQVWREATES